MKERIIKINEELKKIEDQLGKFKTLAGSAKGGAYNVMDLTGIFQAMRHDVQAIDELVLQNQNLSADEVNANKVSFKEAAEKFEGLKNTYSQRKREFADVAGRAFLNYDVVRDTNKKFDNTSKHFGSVVDLMDKGGYLANSGNNKGKKIAAGVLAVVLAAGLFVGGAGIANGVAKRNLTERDAQVAALQGEVDRLNELVSEKENLLKDADVKIAELQGLLGVDPDNTELLARIFELATERDNYKKQVEDLQADALAKEAEIARLNGVVSQKEAEIGQKDARIKELEGQLENANPNDSETIKQLRAELTNARNERDAARSERDKARSERDAARNERDTAIAKYDALNKEYKKVVNENTSLKSENASLKSDNAAKDKTITEKNKTISEKDAKIKSLNEEITGLKSSKTALEQKVAKLEKDLKAEQDKNTQNQAEIKRLQGELKTANDALAQVKKDLASKTAECEELKARDNVKASNALIDWYCEITGTDPSTLSAKDMDSIIAIMNEFMGEPADPVITNQNEQQQPREDHTSQNGQQNEEPDDSYTQDENGLINGGGW